MDSIYQRIEKKKLDIEKRKNIIVKQEKKIETITDEFELRWAKDDLKTSQNKLKDLEIQLVNLNKLKEKQQRKDDIERIPVIEEFLETWKEKVIEWYKIDYQKLSEYQKELRNKRKELEKYLQENKIYHYNSKERREKEKELEIDQETISKNQKRYNSFTLVLSQYGAKWEERLEEEIEKDKNNKREILILKVKEFTGEITDASNLHIGETGEINGFIIGVDGKAKVETISAGGWNIQCYHYRVLVKQIKEKENEN